MNDVRSYVAPFTLGEAMTGGAVGRVAVSRNSRYSRGRVGAAPARLARVGALGRRGLAQARPELPRPSRPLSASSACPASPPGTGCSSSAEPKEGDTVFVSGAAGAVGSAAGQMARIAGCRVIGSAGSAEKLEWLRELGFDDAFDYHEQRPYAALAELAPDGIDIYFDNVGGDHLEAAIGALGTHGRIVACGSISRYNDAGAVAGAAEHVHGRHEAAPHPGLHHHRPLRALRRVRARGDRLGARRPAQYRETIVEGIENAPSAFLGLLRGENIGKMLVKVGPDE